MTGLLEGLLFGTAEGELSTRVGGTWQPRIAVTLTATLLWRISYSTQSYIWITKYRGHVSCQVPFQTPQNLIQKNVVCIIITSVYSTFTKKSDPGVASS
jgi:hypothetical protein